MSLFKGDLLCSFLHDVNVMECVCEVLAQNTRQVIFFSLLKLPLLGYEQNVLNLSMLL